MPKRLMILAAGMSSRMKKETTQLIDRQLINQANNLPKCMIGLGKGGRPFLDYLLMNAAAGGIEEVLLILNPKDNYTQSFYEKHKKNSHVFGLKMLFARQHIPVGSQKPMGTSDAILQALAQFPAWKAGKFIVCNSDNIYPSKVFGLLYGSPQNTMIAFNSVGYSEERVRNCAIVHSNEAGFLVDLIEKPTDQEWQKIKATMPKIAISWNIFGLNASEVIPFFENTPLHPIRNEKELPVSIRMLIQAQPSSMRAIWVDDVVPDLTAKADITDVQEFLTLNFNE